MFSSFTRGKRKPYAVFQNPEIGVAQDLMFKYF